MKIQGDIILPNEQVKLAQKIAYMDRYVYEIMSYAEILPRDEKKEALRDIIRRAPKCGAFHSGTQFKHNPVFILK